MLAPNKEEENLYFRIRGVKLRKKWVSLVLLVLQTTFLVLLMRYSRSSGDSSTRYLSSTAVVSAELMKVFTSIGAMRYDKSSWTETRREIMKELRHPDTLKVAVPGLLYLIQNNLLFIALSNLDAAVYQVTYQLKIMTTALFSVTMLGRSLDGEQIFSLIMLTAGVSLVQYAEMKGSNSPEKVRNPEDDPFLGLICVLLAFFSLGFAGVYLEKVMKKFRSVSLWMRNVQLWIFGAFFGLVVIYSTPKDYQVVANEGFFRGYNVTVWLVVIIQAAGGLLIAAVIQYADNILKGFATSISIVLSSIISVWIFGFQVTVHFVLGASLVVVAVVLFGREKKTKQLAQKI